MFFIRVMGEYGVRKLFYFRNLCNTLIFLCAANDNKNTYSPLDSVT